MTDDTISRQMAIDVIDKIFPADPMRNDYTKGITCGAALAKTYVEQLPSAQPERLTDDDFETIRIHLNAYKEKLCNQQRWGEAEEYQRIIDRFTAFASAQPEPQIIRCKDCKHRDAENCLCEGRGWPMQLVPDDGFCDKGERSEE